MTTLEKMVREFQYAARINITYDAVGRHYAHVANPLEAMARALESIGDDLEPCMMDALDVKWSESSSTYVWTQFIKAILNEKSDAA